YFVFVFFFFSSRRRHTRSYGDWSSDGCSSDLATHVAGRAAAEVQAPVRTDHDVVLLVELVREPGEDHAAAGGAVACEPHRVEPRSEERRVGKECREPRGRCEWRERKGDEGWDG